MSAQRATTTAAPTFTLLKPHLSCRRKLCPLRIKEKLISNFKETLNNLNPLRLSMCKRAFSPRSPSPDSVCSEITTSSPFEKALIRLHRRFEVWSAGITAVDSTITSDGLILISRYALTREEERWCKVWVKQARKMIDRANAIAIYKPEELQDAIDRTANVANMMESMLDVGASRGEWEGAVRMVMYNIRKIQGGASGASGASSCLTIEG